MGKQSARLIFRDKDHKEIYFQGKYHDKIYKGNELLWEKIKTTAGMKRYTAPINEPIVSTDFGNGILIMMAESGRVYITSEFLTYTTVEHFVMTGNRNNVYFAGTRFIVTAPKYVNNIISYSTADGISYEQAADELQAVWPSSKVNDLFAYFIPKESPTRPYDRPYYLKTTGGISTAMFIPTTVYDGRQHPICRTADIAYFDGYYYFSGNVFDATTAERGYYRTMTFGQGDFAKVSASDDDLQAAMDNPVGPFGTAYDGAFVFGSTESAGLYVSYNGTVFDFINPLLSNPKDLFDLESKASSTYNKKMKKWGTLGNRMTPQGETAYDEMIYVLDDGLTIVASEKVDSPAYSVLSNGKRIIFVEKYKLQPKIFVYEEE